MSTPGDIQMGTEPESRTGASTRTRRGLGLGLAILTTQLALLVSDAVDPVGDGTAENLLRAATSSQTSMVTAALLLLVSAVLLVPAVAGMLRLMPRRGRRVGAAGCLLLLLGAFGHAMAATFFLAVAAIPAGPLDAASERTLVEHLNNSPQLMPAFVLMLSFGLGVLLTFVGLRRAGAVPTWVLGTVVGAVLLEFGAPGDAAALSVVKQGLGLVAFGYVAFAWYLGRRGSRSGR